MHPGGGCCAKNLSLLEVGFSAAHKLAFFDNLQILIS